MAIIFATTFYSCAVTKPPAPETNNLANIPAIVQPVSNIEIPVTADLRSYFVQAETSVPNKFTGSQQNCEPAVL